jgi:hypothetical protein
MSLCVTTDHGSKPKTAMGTASLGIVVLFILNTGLNLMGSVAVATAKESSNTTSVMNDTDLCPLPNALENCPMMNDVTCRNNCGARLNLLTPTSPVATRALLCSCDLFCKAFRDCCMDFETECPHIVGQLSSSSTFMAADFEYQLQCDFIGGTTALLNKFLLVTSCPSTWEDDITKRSCEMTDPWQLLDFIPVTHKASGLHFRNVHCSKCHGVAGVVFWSLALVCAGIDPATVVTHRGVNRSALTSTHGTCEFHFDSRHVSKPRRCLQLVSTCNADCRGTWLEDMCSRYQFPVVERKLDLRFKSMYCAACNTPRPYLHCIPRRIPDYMPSAHFLSKLSLTILMDWTPGQDSMDVTVVDNSPWNSKVRQLCSTDLVLNVTATSPGSTNCDPVVCRDGHGLTNESCTSTRNTLTSATVAVRSKLLMAGDSLYMMQSIIIEYWPGTIITSVNFTRNKQLTETFQVTDFIIEFDISHTTEGVMVNCSDFEKIVNTFSEKIIIYLRTSLDFTFDMMVRSRDTPGVTRLLLHIIKTSTKPNANLSCDINETFHSNTSIQIHQAGSSFMVTLGTVSLICMSLSLAGLVILVICMVSCDSFKTFPSRLQLCLSLTLIVAHVCFLLNPFVEKYEALCRWLAICMHWAYLSNFTWINAIAFDVWRKSKQISIPHSESRSEAAKRLLCYGFYAWIGPMVIVSVCVLIDEFASAEAFKAHYGQSRCWIGQLFPMIIFFHAPIGIIVLSNIVFFVWTVVVIIQSGRQTNPQGATRGPRSEFVVCVKMFVLMGVSWITGFLGAAVDDDVTWFVFVLLNSSHGFFLFLALILFNRNILRMCREQCGRNITPPGQNVHI